MAGGHANCQQEKTVGVMDLFRVIKLSVPLNAMVQSGVLLFAISVSLPSHADQFNFGFAPTGVGQDARTLGGTFSSYMYETCNNGLGTCQNGDPTRFEESPQYINGQRYFRVLIGDPATGFAMVSYSPVNSFDVYNDYLAGGQEQSVQGYIDTTQLPTQGPERNNGPLHHGGTYTVLNRNDPFGLSLKPGSCPPAPQDCYTPQDVSGTGGGNPAKTTFRMVVRDSAMSLEVYKPLPDKKARISQTVFDDGMTSLFVADGRGLGFNDKYASAPVTNTFILKGSNTPPAGSGNFEMAMSQNSFTDAGAYSFTPGGGWGVNDGSGWAPGGTGHFWDPNSEFQEGTYNYANSTFDPYSGDWVDFFDPVQNSVVCDSSKSSNPIGNDARTAQMPLSCPGL